MSGKTGIRNRLGNAFVVLVTASFLLAGDGPAPPRGYYSFKFLELAVFLGVENIVNLDPEVPPDIVEQKDLVYREVGGRELALDLYRMKGQPEPAPCLVFIHGGSWRHGERSDYLVYLLDFAEQGYVTASVSYHFSPDYQFPAAVTDVREAVRWIKANAGRLMVDPERIALIGGSAGGHLALMVAYSEEEDQPVESKNGAESSSVQAVVDIYGPVDLTTPVGQQSDAVREFLGKSYLEDPQLFVTASPITHVTADDPPTLIFHGTSDKVVPIRQGDILAARLEQVGVPHEYHRLKGWVHMMDAVVSVNEYFQYHMNDFFQRFLINAD
ncbi:MAG: alpha/beta hydrolase [Candidatus Marinimicrobia bacterium]|nr:alpha/beta hydrolase [Candidatus Neomarinimicrobiota bacterium]